MKLLLELDESQARSLGAMSEEAGLSAEIVGERLLNAALQSAAAEGEADEQAAEGADEALVAGGGDGWPETPARGLEFDEESAGLMVQNETWAGVEDLTPAGYSPNFTADALLQFAIARAAAGEIRVLRLSTPGNPLSVVGLAPLATLCPASRKFAAVG